MNTWGPISAVLHVTTIVAVIVLFGDYHFVDPSLYKVAKDNSGAEALNIASQMGRLDLVSLVLTLAGLLLALLGLYGFIAAKSEAIAESKSTALGAIPDEVRRFMDLKAPLLIRECLSDAEIASGLHAEILKLGLRDTYMAGEVDTDAERREATS
jgi:hypothetical protein